MTLVWSTEEIQIYLLTEHQTGGNGQAQPDISDADPALVNVLCEIQGAKNISEVSRRSGPRRAVVKE